VQGMQAHVGVAGIQEQGVWGLANLAANGTLLYHLPWRFVVRGAWLSAAGGCAGLFVLHHLPACTRLMHRDRHGLSPTPYNCCCVWWWCAGSWPCLTCLWVGVACAGANHVPIAAAGGVEAIVQGMQAHVGVAGIQEQGVGALANLAANGTLLHHLPWRCAERGAWLSAAGECAGLFVLHHLPAAHV